jgi:spore coat protein CotF
MQKNLNSKDIADQVIEDIKVRKKHGKRKYGVPLRAFNNRSAAKDLYEELIDASQYCKQLLIEEASLSDVDKEYVRNLNMALELHTRFVNLKNKKGWTFREWALHEIEYFTKHKKKLTHS